MRRGALLLGLLATLPACGPGGLAGESSGAEEAAPRAAAVRVRHVVAGRPAALASGTAGGEVRLALPADRSWLDARARLGAACGQGAERVVLEVAEGGAGRRVAWHPPRADADAAPPDLRVEVVLAGADAAPCLEVVVRGAPWAVRYGCDAPTSRRVAGWGEGAAAGLDRVLDEALAAVAWDPSRLAASLDVSSSVSSAVAWGDVQPLAETLIRTDAAVVDLLPRLRRGRPERASPLPGLAWLAAHQAADGRWSAAQFGATCDGTPMSCPADAGAGHAAYDVGATGLALLAFLGAGHTHRGRHEFATTVGRGLRFLKRVQDDAGRLADPAAPWFAEQHAIASLALLEAYGTTGSSLYLQPAQAALDALPGVFGSAARDGLPALAFTAAALASAELVAEDARQRGRPAPLQADRDFADEIHSQCLAASGSTRAEEAAVGLFGRILLGGEPARSEGLWSAADVVLLRPPDADRDVDAVHWLFGALALHHVGGAPWKTWNARLKDAVVPRQRRDGAACCYRGSWDPVGAGSGRFGRVGATALRVLGLEIYYRYDRVFGSS